MYEFREQDAWDFSRHVGIEVKKSGDNLHFKVCPYCRPKPTRDNVRSFAINLQTGQFKCLRASCGVSGNMITLSKDFDFSLGSEVDEYCKQKKRYRKFKKAEKPIEPKSEAIQYLESRGISEKIAKEYEITVRNDKPNVLVFPFYDEKGILQFIKYRKTDFDPEKDSGKEWCEKKCKPILFGMKQCKNFDRLVFCEGQIDSLSVAEAGIENAVSVPNGAKGFTWIPYCWDWVNRFSEIVVFGDYEKGRITLLDELSRRFKITVKHVREEDYGNCKDANEILQKCGKEQVAACVENAVPAPIGRVIPLSDVKNIDPFELEKLPTGISQLDRLLYGGLPFGGVVVVTGYAGEGKSTFASQILARAIYHEYKCFAYSGELPDHLFKAWIDFQIAGRSRIAEYSNRWGDRNYKLSDTNREMISEWYRGKCFLYDNTAIEGDEQEGILDIAENVIMQYGVRVVLLDNLMTALDLEPGKAFDKYDKQSLFIKKLARMAKRSDALILLVAHKRKNGFSPNENDEISGSSDISNLAALTISYGKERGKDAETMSPGERKCKVLKNRLFGRTELKGYILGFDEKSKRIYGNGDDLDFDYGWDKTNDGFVEIDSVNTESPFE